MAQRGTVLEGLQVVFGILALIAVLPILAVSAIYGLFRDPLVERTKRDRKETKVLYDQVLAATAASPLGGQNLKDLPSEMVVEACKRAGAMPSTFILEMLLDLIDELMAEEGLAELPEIDWSLPLSMEHGVALRNHLRRRQGFLERFDEYMAQWRATVVDIIAALVVRMPPSALAEEDDDVDTEERPYTNLDVSLIDLIDEPGGLIEEVSHAVFSSSSTGIELFERLRGRLEDNAYRASGIAPEQHASTRKSVMLPSEARNKSATELVGDYLMDTPFARILLHPLSFNIPDEVRFEHCHIVGGTGHGKTQLLQLLIHQDLLHAQEDGRSIIVIDSQGDLIRTITHLALFDPAASDTLADRLVIVDPTDIEYPVRLNMFDFDRGRLSEYGPAQREMILSGTVALFEYMFGALLGSELTEKQGVIFKFLARLMMVIPGATIHTLRDVMENGEAYRPYFALLDGTTRHFFETQFMRKTFDPTKQQIARRLWSILSYPTLERIFSHRENAIDLFEMMNAGKIVVINTAKDLLKEDGSQVLGRFFIALLGQAALERAALPASERRPCFVYVDEAHEYFDGRIEDLLNQARKFKVGLSLAHQNLDQLSAKMRATFMASTSIKLAGGVSSKDARAFAEDMRCDADFIHGMRKRDAHTEFACYIKNAIPGAIKVSVPLGAVEAEPALSADEYDVLIAANRKQYCRHMDEAAPVTELPQLQEPLVPPVPFAEAPTARMRHTPPSAPPLPHSSTFVTTTNPPTQSVPPPEVAAPKPDRQHVYLQNLLRKVAQDRGFRTSIEETILDGTGRVDVSLSRDNFRIACEVTVTTTPEHELGNVLKCLAGGYDTVLVVASSERHLKAVEKHVSANLSEEQREQVLFLSPDEAISFIDEQSKSPDRPKKVRGYNVTVTRKTVSSADAKARQTAVNKLIADSVRRLHDHDSRS